ncbi:DUF3379 family protein [Gallaecimonas xiamenensis]|uniref:DUF3379 domain-containing protein n=1 Tax=Gallaecimonas xiamenensis 3-C-1 TaxID=745411 RepID=K2JLM9_9GAMM|nr:DUF3379 family protein [Gallaecimonas xiamenensis]EKE76213.1 hypothetical protein B3C1_04875 [Gallaecimonas xiamenensis 3-C-1]
MNELEFRRRALSDPQDPALKAAAQDSDANAKLLQEVRQQDAKLLAALKVAAPGNLANRILLNQSLKDFEQRQRRRWRWQLGIAASFAFLAGALLSFFALDRSQLGFSQHALAHVYHEYPTMTAAVDEKATLATFNSKLAAYGGQMDQQVGHIYFVNFCDFDGIKSLHAVLAGEKGRVTLFIVNAKASKGEKEKAYFADGKFDGMAEQWGQHQVILIGEKGEPLQEMENKLKAHLNWSA